MSMHRGQSLLELVVAVGIIAAGLAGILTLTTVSIRAWTEGVRRVQATYLAFEGVELTRNAIETNELSGRPWWQGFRDDGTFAIDTTQFDFTPDVFEVCSQRECRLFRNVVGLYTHADGECADGLCVNFAPSPFSRLIEMREVCEGNVLVDPGVRCPAGAIIGAQVRSAVQWQASGGSREFNLTERWYHWKTL